MRPTSIIFLAVLFVLQACDDESEPEPKPEPELPAFLTVTLSPAHFFVHDMWVFATDETGKVLDVHNLKSDSTVTFRSPSAPEVFNLTTYIYDGGSPANHMFYTYAGITRGQKITLGDQQDFKVIPPVNGKATIKIKNCTPYVHISLSDGISSSSIGNQDNASIETTFDLRQNPSRILLSTHTAIDQPVYGWVDNVTDGGTYAVDFGTFTPFEKTISVSFLKSMSGILIGKKSGEVGNGHVIYNFGASVPDDQVSVAKFGYLDGFDEYKLFVSSTKTLSSYYRTSHYSNYGTNILKEVAFPDNSLSIMKPAISNFEFSYSSDYTYRSHYWKQTTANFTIHWQVFTNKSATPAINELPEPLALKYPSLSVNNLTHINSNFHKYVDGFTYDGVLADIFGQGHISDQHERFSDTFQEK